MRIADDQTGEAVVAESVAHGHGQHLSAWQKILDFSFGAAARGTIELIRTLGQLRGAWQLVRLERLDDSLDFQAGEEVPQARSLFAELFALLVLAVFFGASPVLRSQLQMVEDPAVLKKMGDLVRIF